MKFTLTGSITLSLSLDAPQTHLIIRIVDTGIGISSEFAARMYEPFTKSNEFSVGAGLGLYITQTLVKRMSGTLVLKANKGKNGSTFEVVLPIQLSETTTTPVQVKRKSILTCLDKPSKSQAGVNNNSGLTHTTYSDDQRLRVLIVDDNHINRKLLSLAVRKCSSAPLIDEAADGQQAIDRYTTFRPHLIFTDVSMPVMDGLTATARIREVEQEGSGPPCIIYALTGLGSSDVRLRLDSLMGKASLNGWLVKGEHDMSVIASIVEETAKRQKDSQEQVRTICSVLRR
jgi:CheY-like chemotaxis protein